jgi:hypothetical protein
MRLLPPDDPIFNGKFVVSSIKLDPNSPAFEKRLQKSLGGKSKRARKKPQDKSILDPDGQ